MFLVVVFTVAFRVNTGSGLVEFPEFLSMIAERIQQNDADVEIREAFRVFAKDQDGHIPMEELRYTHTHRQRGGKRG